MPMSIAAVPSGSGPQTGSSDHHCPLPGLPPGTMLSLNLPSKPRFLFKGPAQVPPVQCIQQTFTEHLLSTKPSDMVPLGNPVYWEDFKKQQQQELLQHV